MPYTFKFKWILGVQNCVADLLSRILRKKKEMVKVLPKDKVRVLRVGGHE